MTEYKLEMRGISKEFPGVKALKGVDFTLKRGEIHALLGTNGAGKSTLIRILSGTYRKDAGTILLDGRPIEIDSPQDAMSCGIATVYQEPQILPSFTGFENIFLGYETASKGIFSKINRRQLREKAERILEMFPVDIDLTKPLGQLGAVDHEIVAILRALSRQMSILVLDEPTSILTETEKQVLFRLIAALKERGISIIYISHRLEEMYQVVDRLTIIRDGRNVATLNAKEQGANPLRIAELMLGEKMDAIYPERGHEDRRGGLRRGRPHAAGEVPRGELHGAQRPDPGHFRARGLRRGGARQSAVRVVQAYAGQTFSPWAGDPSSVDARCHPEGDIPHPR